MIEMSSGISATAMGIGVSRSTAGGDAVTSGCRLRGSSSGSTTQLSNQQQPTQPRQQQQRQGPGHMGRSRKDNCCLCWCCCCSCSWNKCLANVGNSSRTDGGVDSTDPDRERNGMEGLDGDIENCLEEIRAWGTSFDQLMKNSAGRELFREFLKGEYSEENIAFWLACEQLKRESSPQKVESRAREIYEDYISILSPKEVSLDSQVREIVNKNMVAPTPHTFDEAQLQIYTLMHRDSYPRFVNSDIYRRVARLSDTPPSPSNAEPEHSSGSGSKSKSKKSLT